MYTDNDNNNNNNKDNNTNLPFHPQNSPSTLALQGGTDTYMSKIIFGDSSSTLIIAPKHSYIGSIVNYSDGHTTHLSGEALDTAE